jgi:hypothetical protein
MADLDALTQPLSMEDTLAALGSQDAPVRPASTPTADLAAVGPLLKRLEQLVSAGTVKPKWLSAAQVRTVYGLDQRRLAQLVARGLVKRAKMGEAAQAQALYRVEDLDRVLEDIADGRINP